MARVSTYLNFPRNTEEAFAFYKSVFKTEYACPIARFSDGKTLLQHLAREIERSQRPNRHSAQTVKLIAAT